MSVSFQITLSDELASALKRAAAHEELPLADYIRATIIEKLMSGAPASDPFACITDLAAVQDTDLAARVDEILYK